MLSLGALHKQTRQYVYPKIASKKDQYVCPECDKDLILCQGAIRVHHFRHKVDHINPCHHYDHPSEAQIHKDAKLVLKTMLDNHVSLSFARTCIRCRIIEEYEIPPVTETSAIVLEHRFSHNDKLAVADVAYLDQNLICCLFEICNTHQTKEGDRPEPWVEINAETLIQKANNRETSDGTGLVISCIRETRCEDCLATDKKQELVECRRTNLEKYVRMKLDRFRPDQPDLVLPTDPNYNHLFMVKYENDDTECYDIDAQWKYNRDNHLRFHYNGEHRCKDAIACNKDIVGLFASDFGDKHIVVHSWKGFVYAHVVSNYAYSTYDYWPAEYYSGDMSRQYPCEMTYEFVPGHGEDKSKPGTTGILAHLIRYCDDAIKAKQEKMKRLKKAIGRGRYLNNMRDPTRDRYEVKEMEQKMALIEHDVHYTSKYCPVTMNKWTNYCEDDEIGLQYNALAELNYIHVDYVCETEDNMITIVHLVTRTKIIRDCSNEQTFYKGEWRTNITLDHIITWYHCNIDVLDVLV